MTEYGELHAHSNLSFLDGASHPEELVAEAARLGLTGLAITDRDGLYAAVRQAETARDLGVATVFGAELSVGLTKRQNGIPDPEGEHLVVLARDPDGYARLSRAIAEGQLAGSKGRPVYDLASLADAAGGHWLITTACRKGSVPAALGRVGPTAAGRELDRLVEAFGRENVVVEVWRHDDPLDTVRNDALVLLADARRVDVIATSNAHYASPSGQHVAAALAAIRSRRSMDEVDPWLPAGPSAHLRSGAEQARRFRRWPGVVERAGELGRELAFDLRLIAPALPPCPIPPGFADEMAFPRHLTETGAEQRYGPRHAETVPGAWAQIDRELAVIEQLGFPGYFLVVWDITQFCLRSDILCQGRGSAANSAVCFSLGVTKADAVRMGLLFERFLSVERDGPPDIDIDIENGRREQVIQYVYDKHDRRHAAQVANIITYRSRSAIREAAKALGHSPGAIDAWSKQLERYGRVRDAVVDSDVPENVVALAQRLENLPRHLGIHSGGMVMCNRPVVEVCPVEWGTMPGRTVLQWDKKDCASAGLVKFDLLGLGMLSAVHRTIDLIADHHDVTVDLAALPQEDEVYDLLCNADTVGVFQVESRAQMATLPRLRHEPSTTWSSRSPSSGPARSKAAASTLTSAGGTAANRSPTYTPCWRSAWSARSVSPCSKNS
jgi:error-prone DNA polymerase